MLQHDPESSPYLFGVAAACFLLMLGLLVFAVGMWLSEPRGPPRNMFDVPGQLNALRVGWSISWPQRWAHRAMLLGLLGLVGLLTLLGERRSAALATAARWPWAPLTIGFWGACMIVLAALPLPTGFAHIGGLAPRRALGSVIGILVTTGLFAFRRQLSSRRSDRISFALVLVLLALLFLPALAHKLDLSRQGWSDIAEWQIHYETVLGQAAQLSTERPPASGVVPFYGLVVPMLLGSVQRLLGPWTLGDYVRFVELVQLAFFLLLLPSYARYTRGRWFLVLPVVAFAALDFHFHTYLLVYPNLMGVRFLAFPLAFLGWRAAYRRPEPSSALLLGTISGACLLYGPATGSVATLGLASCVALRRIGASTPRPTWTRIALLFTGGLGLCVMSLLLLGRAWLGDWLRPSWPLLLARNVRIHAGGLSDAPAYDPVAMVMFAHASAVLVQAWIERREPLSFRRGTRVLAAILIVLWFGYYANRPNLGYLSSLLAPYSFLLLDNLRVVMLGPRRAGVGRWKLGLSFALLSLVVVPRLVLTLRYQAPAYCAGIEQTLAGEPPDAIRIQGVSLPRDARTRRILTQSAFLRAQPAEERLIYFTVDNYLVAQQAGAWPELPLTLPNAFYGTFTASEFRTLLLYLQGPEVERIYFDSSLGLTRRESETATQLQIFYDQLRTIVSRRFVLRRRIAGWEEWVRP